MHVLGTGNASSNGYPSWNSRVSAKMGVEPGDGAADAVALVLGLHEHVAFVFVDDERGRFHVFDEGDRRAFRVDLGVVVDGLAEKRDHPLVDLVFAVVAQIVGDAGAGHGGFEAVGLRDAPHGHETAIAPAGKAEAVRIDGSDAEGFVYSGEDVAKIAVAEIADVGAREGFALAKAAARIRLENKIA